MHTYIHTYIHTYTYVCRPIHINLSFLNHFYLHYTNAANKIFGELLRNKF